MECGQDFCLELELDSCAMAYLWPNANQRSDTNQRSNANRRSCANQHSDQRSEANLSHTYPFRRL
jgi:hypothetical protein